MAEWLKKVFAEAEKQYQELPAWKRKAIEDWWSKPFKFGA